MARLTIPEPNIDLYIDGFDGHDHLERKQTANALSDLVDRIEDPMVIALDGGWGSGKSFFLKCWVGEHLKREGNKTQTVYFDAFANDFMDEPMVSLMACLLDRFEELGPEEKSKLDKAKTIARKLGPAALRVSASLATFGATNHLDDVGDAIAEAVGAEVIKSSDTFWKEAQERQGAMQQFREALGALTTVEGSVSRKLVVVVDELDRCRPDYALALLEIIKHFFAVPNVHFVLGVNLIEIENSVKARYGSGINAGLYLQKFVTLTLNLPETLSDVSDEDSRKFYLKKLGEEMSLEKEFSDLMSRTLVLGYPELGISLRSVRRILSMMATTNSDLTNKPQSVVWVISSLIILKTHRKELYHKARNAQLVIEDIETAFSTTGFEPEDEVKDSYLLYRAWMNYLQPDLIDSAPMWNGFDLINRNREKQRLLLQRHIGSYLETFRLPDI